MIQENKYKSAKTNSFKEEIRTVFYDDGLPVEETQSKAYLIILVILNTESTIVSKIFFILSKYLSFFRFKTSFSYIYHNVHQSLSFAAQIDLK